MPDGPAVSTLWDVHNTGEVRSGSNQYTGGFKDWLDNKVKKVYPITDCQPEIRDLKVGSIIDLSLYTTIE